MGTTKQGAEARTEKHRKAHKLVQVWVEPAYWKVLAAKAKSEDRSIANYVRREIAKVLGIKVAE